MNYILSCVRCEGQVTASEEHTKWSQVNKGLFVVANSATSLVEAAVLYPFELIKTREQIGNQGVRVIVRNAWKQGGVVGFYRGFSWNALGGLPSEVLFFYSYNVMKEKLAVTYPHMPEVGVHCCAGAAAEVVGTAIWVPMDIVCQRMQAQSMYAPPAEYQGLKFKRYNAKGTAIVRSIATTDGARGFWRGIGLTMAIQLPSSAITMAGYEHMKIIFMRMWKLPEDHPGVHLAAGGMAGMATAIITNPLDVLKTRFQVDTKATTVRKVLQELLQEHGRWGLCRGMLPRALSLAPRSSLSFILYELAMKVASMQDIEIPSALSDANEWMS